MGVALILKGEDISPVYAIITAIASIASGEIGYRIGQKSVKPGG